MQNTITGVYNPHLISKAEKELDTILSSYVGHQATKIVVEHMQQHANRYLTCRARVRGGSVRLRLVTTTEGVIKKVRFDIVGNLTLDPYAPLSFHNTPTLTYPRTHSDQASNRQSERIWSLDSPPQRQPDKQEPKKTRSQLAQKCRSWLTRRWSLLKAKCPVAIKWKQRPEPNHPLFNIPMSHFEELRDVWRVTAGLIDEDQLAKERQERERVKKLNKWWNIWPFVG